MYVDSFLYTDTSPVYNHFTGLSQDNGLKVSDILFDNYEFIVSFTNRHVFRTSVLDDVQMALLCHTSYLGHIEYECPKCHKTMFITAFCHSPLCSSCGVKESKERAASVGAMVVDAPHRHAVFTIPRELTDYFLRYRNLLNLLFIAARNALADVANDRKYRKTRRKQAKVSKNKSKVSRKAKTGRKRKTPYDYKDDDDRMQIGAVMTLHTFGRDLKWNPHIHVLMCEQVYDRKNDKLKDFKYLNFQKLRSVWQYQVLKILSESEELKNDYKFRRLKNKLYSTYDNGFYVHAPRKKNADEDTDVDQCVKYITRYTSRPAMADSRLLEYDDRKKTIRYWYERHEDGERVEVFEYVYLFLFKLLRHCPNPNFKMVRYYGFYSNRGKKMLEHIYELNEQLVRRHRLKIRLRSKKQRKKKLQKDKKSLHYRTLMIESFSRDPLICSCGETMDRVAVFDPFKGEAVNDRQYRHRSIYACIRDDRIARRGNDSGGP